EGKARRLGGVQIVVLGRRSREPLPGQQLSGRLGGRDVCDAVALVGRIATAHRFRRRRGGSPRCPQGQGASAFLAASRTRKPVARLKLPLQYLSRKPVGRATRLRVSRRGASKRPRRAQRLLLLGGDGPDAVLAQFHKSVELLPREGRLLTASLHFDELARAGHHQVHIHFGIAILHVLEIEAFLAIYDADAHRRDAGTNHFPNGNAQALLDTSNCIDDGDEGAVDGGGARAAVGFQHVAIDPQGPFAELAEIDGGPQAPADQPLNLHRAAVDLAALVAGLAGVGGTGQHAVLGGEPAGAAAGEEIRHLRLHAASAQYRGAPGLHEHGARRAARILPLERARPQLVRVAMIGTGHGVQSILEKMKCRRTTGSRRNKVGETPWIRRAMTENYATNTPPAKPGKASSSNISVGVRLA